MLSTVFVIDDEFHAETHNGEFTSFSDALIELKRLSEIPWNEPPNLAPCTGWKTCGRKCRIIEYDISSGSWKEVSRVPTLQIESTGVTWLYPATQNTAEQDAAANP